MFFFIISNSIHTWVLLCWCNRRCRWLIHSVNSCRRRYTEVRGWWWHKHTSWIKWVPLTVIMICIIIGRCKFIRIHCRWWLSVVSATTRKFNKFNQDITRGKFQWKLDIISVVALKHLTGNEDVHTQVLDSSYCYVDNVSVVQLRRRFHFQNYNLENQPWKLFDNRFISRIMNSINFILVVWK